jgi:hypothetical protein
LPLAKYNALLVAHQMLLTAKYAALTFLELYLLPILGDIALYCAHRRKEEDLELYFIERGYRDSIGIRKISNKFVKFTVQIIFLAATIKPYRNLLQVEQEWPSSFGMAAAKLREKGVSCTENCTGKEVQSLRIAYIK